MFDHCVPSIALSWNNNVLSAYYIDFAGERERGRKQRNFVSKIRDPFGSKLIIFRNEASRIKFRRELRAENRHVSVHELDVTIVVL